MPPDGISYRFAYPEYFQYHEDSVSEPQTSNEIDEKRLELCRSITRAVKPSYLSMIKDSNFVPERPHRSAFWETGSQTKGRNRSERDLTAEIYPSIITKAETENQKKMLIIRRERNQRAMAKLARSRSQSSGGSHHSTRANTPSHSEPSSAGQRFGQHLNVPASAPFVPLTQHTSAQLNYHTGNQHIVTPQASAYPPGSGNGPTVTVDGDVWASWPDGTKLGTYHTPTRDYNALTDTHIPQIMSYVPQVLQTTPQVHCLTDPLPAAHPFLVNRTHLQTMGGPSVDLGKQAAADVWSYPTWDPSFEVKHGDYAVNTAGSSFTQSNNTPLSQASPYQASHSNTRTSSINQWLTENPMAGYPQPRFQHAGSTTYSGYNTDAIGQEPNVPSFDWPPVGSGQSSDPNLDDQQRRGPRYPPQ